MQWPWINRATAELIDSRAMVRENGLLREIELLQRELEYYRAKYEAEKERADRAVDNLIQMTGREPISQVAIREKDSQAEAIEAMTKQVQDIFAEVSESLNGKEESETEIEPEKTPTAEELAKDREQRLTALREFNMIRFPKKESEETVVK